MRSYGGCSINESHYESCASSDKDYLQIEGMHAALQMGLRRQNAINFVSNFLKRSSVKLKHHELYLTFTLSVLSS